MTSDADAIQKLLAEKSTYTRRVGSFIGADGQYAVVDIGGTRVSIPFATGFVPEVNEPVLVDSIDGTLWLAGPVAAKPGLGVVVAVPDEDHVTVDTAFGSVTMPFHDGDEMDIGDIVCIVWSSGPYAFKLSTSPDDVNANPAPPGSSGGVQTAEFRAIDSGSTDRGSARWWTSQVYASSSTYGAWFYGTAIPDTIPAAATFVSLQIYVSWVSKSGGAPRLVTHNLTSKSGLPSVSAYTEWSPGSGYQTPPNAEAIFNSLKAGGGYFGVGFNQGGRNVFNSLASDGMSGALKIQWK